MSGTRKVYETVVYDPSRGTGAAGDCTHVIKIPVTDKQTPYDLGRSLPDHERENLLAIAPGIVLRDVL